MLRREKKGFAKFISDVVKFRYLLLMLIPAVVYVILFAYLPMTGIIVAFKKYNYNQGIYKSPWVGLNNFKFLFISKKLWPLTRNTLGYNLAFIVFGMFFQVSFAIILNEIRCKVFKKTAQSIMFLPYFISWVVVAAMVQAFFGYETGLVSKLIENAGGTRINITTTTWIWPFLLVFLNLFKGTGYGTVVYLAAITGMDQEIYEAAEVDGANVWQRIKYITIPFLKPTMATMFMLALGGVFRGDFGLFYQTIGNNGQLLEVADVLDLFIYRVMISNNDIGMSAAAGFYQSILCFATIVTVNSIIKRVNPDYTLF
ncbi:MAG: sugar ABC transporter permease [Lachnospiraceae bacterium]|nr:sugar ABC transporter permease [Lachnospiraceae bacterium]